MTHTETLSDLIAPGRGIVVADHYLATDLERLGPNRHGLTGEAFVDLVLDAPGIATQVSGALMSHQLFTRCTTRWRAEPSPTARGSRRFVHLGVRIDPRTATDGVERRLDALRDAGVTFVEWRAHVPPLRVRRGGTHVDATALARGAAESVRSGITPVLTVAMPDLGTHSAVVARAVLTNALRSLVEELDRSAVSPRDVFVRSSFVMAGDRHDGPTAPAAVGAETARLVREALPGDIGGIAFLSSGLRAEPAARRLAAVAETLAPVPVTFAFGRALTTGALNAWRSTAQAAALQQQFARDCELASAATQVPVGAASA